MLRIRREHDLDVGDTVGIIPNHVCSPVNLHNEVFFADESGAVEWIAVSARGRLE